MKQAIPATRTGQHQLDQALSAIKQNLDQITGQARGQERLAPLPSNATLAQVIERLNAIADRLQ